MKAIYLVVFFLAAVVRLWGQDSVILRIAVTTDVHGAYFPADWHSGDRIPGSLAQVHAWVREQRNLPGEELILLDNGDLIQGDPASYYSNFIDTTGPHIAARIMNFMGYDAATAGNHDIEAGHPVYDPLIRDFKFPWMAANAVRTSDSLPYFQPFTILRRAGLTIAVIGLITPKIPDWLPRRLWSGMEYRDMVESARHWTRQVIGLEKPDLVIGLFHSGAGEASGQDPSSGKMRENASRLVAEQVAGFDIIFTGHDHRHRNLKVAGPEGDSVLILGSESRAREVAVATLMSQAGRMDPGVQEGQGGKAPARITGEHVKITDYLPDTEFIELFSGYIDTVQKYVDQPVGLITATVGTEDAYFGPSGFTDLIHRAQLEITGADVSFAAPLSFQAVLSEGILAVKDLFNLYRYENQLYTMRLTGREIAAYLNYSYSLWMNRMTGPDDLLLNIARQPDGSWRFRNASYNFDSAMGIDYLVDVSQPAGRMVRITRLSDGRPFEPDREYVVALNSYRASGGGGHLSVGAGLSKQESEKRLLECPDQDFRFLLAEWIRQKGTLHPAAGSNWKVVPEEWFRKAALRDRERLFGEGAASR